MKKIIIFAAVSIVISGCDKSAEEYFSDIDAAKEKVTECKSSSEFSKGCQNAKQAIKKHNKIMEERKRLAEEEKLKNLKESLLSFDYHDYVKERDSCSGLKCKAANQIKDEMIKKEMVRVRGLINGDYNLPEYKNKVCKGLEANEVDCRIALFLDDLIEKEWEERILAEKEYFLENRGDLKKMYNQCRETLLGYRNDFPDIKDLDPTKRYKLSDASIMHYPRNDLSEEDYLGGISTYRYMGLMEDSQYVKCDAARKAATYLSVSRANEFRKKL